MTCELLGILVYSIPKLARLFFSIFFLNHIQVGLRLLDKLADGISQTDARMTKQRNDKLISLSSLFSNLGGNSGGNPSPRRGRGSHAPKITRNWRKFSALNY